MSDGTPFDENKQYKVAVNSYRGNGGGELLTKGAGIPRDSLAKRIIWESNRDQRYYLMKEIERLGTIAPKANNNWRFVPENGQFQQRKEIESCCSTNEIKQIEIKPS